MIYHLHPTFVNPNRTVSDSPFKIEEQGWGGFPLDISVFFLDKAGERKIPHDLNFLQEEYEVDHVIQVPINKPNLVRELEKSGGIEDTGKRKAADSTVDVGEPKAKKTKSSSNSTIKGNVDLEKLALGLTKLTEDDLIGVVQMITDNNIPEMNVTNNVDDGEFIIDLYSLPDELLKSLSDYVKKHSDS